MQCGDYVHFRGRQWTIVLLAELSRIHPGFRSGRYAVLAAPHEGEYEPEIVIRVEHEDAIRAGWRPGPTFARGDVVPHYDGEPMTVHYIDADNPMATLIDQERVYVPVWKWHLSFLAACEQPFSVENAPFWREESESV